MVVNHNSGERGFRPAVDFGLGLVSSVSDGKPKDLAHGYRGREVQIP